MPVLRIYDYIVEEWVEVSVTQSGTGTSDSSHNHNGIYEPSNSAIVDHIAAVHAPFNADNTAANETSHADVLVDSDIGISVSAQHDHPYEPFDAAIQTHITAPHAVSDADNTAANETSHSDVLVDSDIGVSVAAQTHNHSGVYDPAGSASGAISTHIGNYAHEDIAHSNRTALDLVSGTNTGDQDLSGYAQLPPMDNNIYVMRNQVWEVLEIS